MSLDTEYLSSTLSRKSGDVTEIVKIETKISWAKGLGCERRAMIFAKNY
jgi:hypothetical protein